MVDAFQRLGCVRSILMVTESDVQSSNITLVFVSRFSPVVFP